MEPVKPTGSVNIEIISTGDELLYGRILDTNSHWLAKRVAEIGAKITRVTMIGDEPDVIASTLQEALGRDAQFIIFTGGLGPSSDDLTVYSIGLALDRSIIIDKESAEKIRSVYRNRGITDHTNIKRGERMARILEGSIAIQNPVGFAVGMIIELLGKTICTLPGVPAEMRGMFDSHVAPLIEEKSNSKFEARAINVKMVWKDFFPLYRQLQNDYPDMYIKNAATPPVEDEDRNKIQIIKVDLVLEASTVNEAKRKMESFLDDYRKRIDAVGGGEIILLDY
jgi:molybdenum cofactor synthesis domain-containing protein